MLGTREVKIQVTPDFGETFKAIERLKRELNALGKGVHVDLGRSMTGVQSAVGKAVRDAGTASHAVARQSGQKIGQGILGGIVESLVSGGGGGIRGALAQAMRRGGAEWATLGGGLSGLTRGLGVGGIAGAAVGSAVVAGGAGLAYATKQAADFQSTMAKIAATVPDARGQMEELAKVARQLGTETVYGSKQAAEGLLHLLWAGLNVKQSVGALPNVLNFATAAELNVGEAAEYASTIMIGFQKDASELAKIMEIMAISANRFPMEVRDMGPALARSAAAAREMGQDVATTSALIGALSTAHFKGETAGYQMMGMMQRLSGGYKDVEKILERGNITVGNARQGYKNLFDIFDSVNRAFQQGLIESGDITKIFGEEGIRVYRSYMSVGAEAMRKVREEAQASDTMMKNMSKTMEETFWGATKKMGSALEDLGIALGDPILKPLTEGIKKLTEWINKMKDASELAKKGGGKATAGGDWTSYFFGLDWLFGPQYSSYLPTRKPGARGGPIQLGEQVVVGAKPPQARAPLSEEDRKFLEGLKKQGQSLFGQPMGGVVNTLGALDKFEESIYARWGSRGKKALEEQRIGLKALSGGAKEYHEYLEYISRDLDLMPEKQVDVVRKSIPALEALNKSIRGVWAGLKTGAAEALKEIPPLFSTVSAEGELVQGSLVLFGQQMTVGFRNALSSGFRRAIFAGGDKQTQEAIDLLEQLRKQVVDKTTNTNTATIFQALMGLSPGGQPFGAEAAEIQTAIAKGAETGLEAIDTVLGQLKAQESFVGRFQGFFKNVWAGMKDTFEQSLSDLFANMTVRGTERLINKITDALSDDKTGIPSGFRELAVAGGVFGLVFAISDSPLAAAMAGAATWVAQAWGQKLKTEMSTESQLAIGGWSDSSEFSTTVKEQGSKTGSFFGQGFGKGLGDFLIGAGFAASISNAMGGSTFGNILSGVLGGGLSAWLGAMGIGAAAPLSMFIGSVTEPDRFTAAIAKQQDESRDFLKRGLQQATFAELSAFTEASAKTSQLVQDLSQALLYSGLGGNKPGQPWNPSLAQYSAVAGTQVQTELQRRLMAYNTFWEQYGEAIKAGPGGLQGVEFTKLATQTLGASGLFPEGFSLPSGSNLDTWFKFIEMVEERFRQSPLFALAGASSKPASGIQGAFGVNADPLQSILDTLNGFRSDSNTKLSEISAKLSGPGGVIADILNGFRADLNAGGSPAGSMFGWIQYNTWRAAENLKAFNAGWGIPSFQTGPGETKIVPGSPGAPMLAIVHGQERVSSGEGGGVINVGPFYIGAGASQVDERHVRERIVPIVLSEIKRASFRNKPVIYSSGTTTRRTV